MKLLGLGMILAGAASVAFASGVPVPEIDGTSAVSAVALISGGLLVIRGRRRKQ
jgi:hypothetical protein